MACPKKVYINSHTIFVVTISEGFTIPDISELEMSFTLPGRAAIQKLKSTGGIVVDAQATNPITVIIESTDISVAGLYHLECWLTDTNSKRKKVSITIKNANDPNVDECQPAIYFHA